MKTGEIQLDIQPKTESPHIKQKEVKTMHEVEQNKGFFKREREENTMNQGFLNKKLRARIQNRVRLGEEREVVMRYVDTYSG